jgi:hypothetical protein
VVIQDVHCWLPKPYAPVTGDLTLFNLLRRVCGATSVRVAAESFGKGTCAPVARKVRSGRKRGTWRLPLPWAPLSPVRWIGLENPQPNKFQMQNQMPSLLCEPSGPGTWDLGPGTGLVPATHASQALKGSFLAFVESRFSHSAL